MNSSRKTDIGPLQLQVYGPAGLKGPQGRLGLRRKSLAILYWLAFEGPTHRERLADLLWDTADPLSNLRVELNSINNQLRAAGHPGLEPQEDPLSLPRGVVLAPAAPGGDQPLEGLDGFEPDFQEWLDWRRARLRGPAVPLAGFEPLLATLGSLRAPHLLVAETLPFAGAGEFAEALARHLRLPFMPLGTTPGRAGVRLIAAPYPEGTVARVLADRQSIHVLERPFFGPDPTELLQLRFGMQAADISYVKLSKPGWFAARSHLLVDTAFPEAAEAYLASAGHPGCLAEILAMPKELRGAVPQKYRAALELNLRRLTPACRHALEELAVAGHLPAARELLLQQHAGPVQELVEERWLACTETAWEFTSGFAAGLLRRSLAPATFRAACGRVALLLEQAGRSADADAMRRHAAGEPASRTATAPRQARAAAPRKKRVRAAPEERFQDVPRLFGSGADRAQELVAFVRGATPAEEGGLVFSLPGAPELLRLSGSAHSPVANGSRSPGEPRLTLLVDGEARAVLSPGLSEGMRGKHLQLPLPEQFDYWFLLPAAGDLALTSGGCNAVIELKLRFYGLDSHGTEQEAWALEA